MKATQLIKKIFEWKAINFIRQPHPYFLNSETKNKPIIALIAWGNVIEDFLNEIGISLETFCQEFTGSWLFGYITALQRAEVTTVLFCISSAIKSPVNYTHIPTGATVCVLPASWPYRVLLKISHNPYGRNVRQVFGELKGWQHLLFPVFVLLQKIILYLPTPPLLLYRELKRQGCAAILCQEYEYPRFDVCVALGKIMNIPVFASFQGGNYQRSTLEHYLRPLAMKACTGLIIPSTTEAQRVQNRYKLSPTKISRIFNPVDLDLWQPTLSKQEVRMQLEIPADAGVVVWHGRVMKQKKGLDLLLEAWQQVCQKQPHRKLRLFIIGTGRDAEELHCYAAALGINNVTWIDHFFHDCRVIQQYLMAADVYAFPSRHEGFPVAVVEAMAISLPVIATDVSGIPDLLEGEEFSGGLIVPCNESGELARALERLLENKEWCQELGRRARRRVEVTCSLEVVGKQLQALVLSQQHKSNNTE